MDPHLGSLLYICNIDTVNPKKKKKKEIDFSFWTLKTIKIRSSTDVLIDTCMLIHRSHFWFNVVLMLKTDKYTFIMKYTIKYFIKYLFLKYLIKYYKYIDKKKGFLSCSTDFNKNTLLILDQLLQYTSILY